MFMLVVGILELKILQVILAKAVSSTPTGNSQDLQLESIMIL